MTWPLAALMEWRSLAWGSHLLAEIIMLAALTDLQELQVFKVSSRQNLQQSTWLDLYPAQPSSRSSDRADFAKPIDVAKFTRS